MNLGFTSELFLFLFLPASALIYLLAHYIGKGRADKIAILVICALFYAFSSIGTLLIFIMHKLFKSRTINIISFSTVIENL